ncbi:MAG TPA: signal peptidase I [Propionibacteriaceae bacterium]
MRRWVHDNPWQLAAVLAVGALLISAVAIGLAWRLSGGNWAIVETPSMGRAVPVGTLIVTKTRPLDDIHVGDVVTYQPPNLKREWFTHRVVQKFSDGTLQVQGDVNGSPDPFAVTQANLVGKVVHQVYGIGWLIHALPYLIVGLMVIFVVTGTYVRSRWRSAARIMSICLLLAIAALILRPFVHPYLMSVSTDTGTPYATVVSAGLMPTRVTGAPGEFIDLVNGQEGVVRVASVAEGAPFMINGTPHLNLPWLFLVIGICAFPLLWCLIVGLSPDEDER